MNKITPITKNKTINQMENSLKIFEQNCKNSCLTDYNLRLKNSDKILIASTEGLSKSIIQELLSVKKGAIYIVLKDFNKQLETLSAFNSRKPVIVREVPSLNNNFIITDSEATIFINSLSNDKNICMKLDMEQKKDLFYWFNYYFWDNATNEKMIDKISLPKESPYPSLLKLDKDCINLTNHYTISTTKHLIVPRSISSKKFIERVNFENCSLSDDINENIYLDDKMITIGNFRMNVFNLPNIGRTFVYKEALLKDIKHSFIPDSDKDFSKTYDIEKEVKVVLEKLRAPDIESMNSTSFNNIPSHPYCLNINCEWEVLPPRKGKNSSKSIIYNQYQVLQKNFLENIKHLDQVQSITKNDSFIEKLRGFKNSFKSNESKVIKWKRVDFEHMELSLITEKTQDFEELFNAIINNDRAYNNAKKKEKAKNAFEEKQDKTKKELDKIQEVLQTLQNKKKEESDSIAAKKASKEKLVKEEEKLISKIKSLKIKLQEEFTWTDAQNELDVMYSKNKENNYDSFIPLKLPHYNLPEIGILFEDSNNYYLQIENYEDLEQANNMKQRYVDKEYHVVVKE